MSCYADELKCRCPAFGPWVYYNEEYCPNSEVDPKVDRHDNVVVVVAADENIGETVVVDCSGSILFLERILFS